MANLIYLANASLDGYTEDRNGRFDWTQPSEDYFAFVTGIVRGTGTHLYGRRMYESMRVWETDPSLAALSALFGDFAEAWQAGEKIVYSRTLEAVSTRNTKLVRSFDPEAIRRLKAGSAQDILIGGPELAAQALRTGLVDECRLVLLPIVVGGGKPALPDGLRLGLELLEQLRFDNGSVYLRYRIRQPGAA